MFASYDLARKSDIVYSEVLSKAQFNRLIESHEVKILSSDSNLVFYKLLNFKLSTGDIIFTHTGNLFNLFNLIKNLDKNLNLTLITHQSDTEINKKLFEKKPKCIKRWFAINVNYKNENLIPLPLGLANEMWDQKNIISKKAEAVKINQFFIKKNNLLYLNFTNSTNRNEREWLKPYFKKFNWVEIDEENLNIDDYINKVKNSSFILCPWGNGFDSHRIWEALSLGSIPVVKRHLTFEQYQHLPILFVDDFREVNEKLLLSFLKSDMTKFKLEELDLNYWLNKLNIENKDKNKLIHISEPKLVSFFYEIRNIIKSKINKYTKKFRYYVNKINKIRKS